LKIFVRVALLANDPFYKKEIKGKAPWLELRAICLEFSKLVAHNINIMRCGRHSGGISIHFIMQVLEASSTYLLIYFDVFEI
jgi:hypothetical protein